MGDCACPAIGGYELYEKVREIRLKPVGKAYVHGLGLDSAVFVKRGGAEVLEGVWLGGHRDVHVCPRTLEERDDCVRDCFRYAARFRLHHKIGEVRVQPLEVADIHAGIADKLEDGWGRDEDGL